MKWQKIGLIGFAFCFLTGGVVSAQEISVWSTQTDPPQIEAQKKIAKEFEGFNPGIKVNMEFLPWKDVYTKTVAAGAAGVLPEVSTPDPTPLMAFAAKGMLEPLDDVIQDLGRADFFPQALSLTQYQGHDYSVPYRLQAMVLFYRKDLLDQKKIKIPTNWKEWLDAAKLLTEDTNGDGVIDRWGCVLPYGRTSWTDSILFMLIWQNGGSIFDEKNQVTFNTPAVHEALEYYKKMFPYSPKGSEAYSYNDSINAFITGKAAMSVYYGRLVSRLAKDAPQLKDKFGAALIPSEKKVAYPIGGGCLSVFKRSKHPELGKKFIKHFMQSKHFAEFVNATPLHAIPSRKSIAQSKEFRNNELITAFPEIYDTLMKSISFSYSQMSGPNNIPNMWLGEIAGANVFSDTVQRVVLKNEPPKDAAAWAAKRMEEILQGRK